MSQESIWHCPLPSILPIPTTPRGTHFIKGARQSFRGAPTLSLWAQPALLPWSEAHQHDPSLPSGENSPVSVI